MAWPCLNHPLIIPKDDECFAAWRQNAAMDFSLNEDQVMIRDAAQSYLADHCGSEAVRAAIASEAGYDPAVWQAIAAELGWCGVAIPEEFGGMGLGPVELMLIQEQVGYYLLPSPFFSTVCLVANILMHQGSAEAKSALLPLLAAGELRATTVVPSEGEKYPEPTLRAIEVGGVWQVSGAVRVPDVGRDGLLLAFARTDEGPGLFQVPLDAAGIDHQPLQNWDASRRFVHLSLDNVAAQSRCDDAHAFRAGCPRSEALIRLYIAAEQLGAAQRCLDLTVTYVSERKQFGRVVGSFQAVKHRCAEMMVQVESLRSAVYGAAALAAGDGRVSQVAIECAMAKAMASEALCFCAGEAIQLHGGVGFTEEYDPQLFFKRAQASRHWMGTPQALRAEIAEVLL